MGEPARADVDRSRDPRRRQTIYIRRVQKVGGELVNVPFDKIENVKDPARARGPK